MVIYDLNCVAGHEFEGWFGDADDFLAQKSGGLLLCPICNSKDIDKKLSVPKVQGVKSNQRSSSIVAEPGTKLNTNYSVEQKRQYNEFQHALRKVHHYIDTNFDNVGRQFASEAIRMHKGEAEERPIRGTASADELKKLDDLGVKAVPIPDKPVDKEKLN